MRWVYIALQIGILAGVIWLNEEMKADIGSGMSGLAVGVMAVGFAAIATAIVYWSIRGIKRLLGYPPELPVIPPPSMFENLRPKPKDSLVSGRHPRIEGPN